MNKMLKKWAALAGTAMLLCSLTGCGNQAAAGSLRFGTQAELPPFGYVTTSGAIAQYVGLDMELAKEIASRNEYMPRIENMGYDYLVVSLQSGRIDCAISGIAVNPAWEEEIDFSTPYYEDKQVLLMKSDSNYEKAGDVGSDKFAVLIERIGERKASQYNWSFEAFQNAQDAVEAVEQGVCGAMIIDSASANYYVNERPGLKIVEDPECFEVNQYALAVKKGNTPLLTKINKTIEEMKEDGSLEALIKQYIPGK